MRFFFVKILTQILGRKWVTNDSIAMVVLGDQDLRFCTNKDNEQIEFWHISK